MIDLYYWTTPNGHKITMFLEEAGLEYKIFPINIGKGDQFKPEFLAIAPNNRIPAMVDHEPKGGGKPISIFESGAMLLYLAEKTGKFLPADIYGRYDAIQWTFWQRISTSRLRYSINSRARTFSLRQMNERYEKAYTIHLGFGVCSDLC